MKRHFSHPHSPLPTGKRFKEEDAPELDGMDELLAVLGYKVKTSDMAQVALKLEQLEEAMSVANVGTAFLDDSIHSNPSDLSSWLESMLSEFAPNQLAPPDYDLKAIPGDAVFPPPVKERDAVSVPTIRPVVVVDSQENGIRLVHLLLACAEAIQASNFAVAEAIVKQINFLAASQVGAMRKVASYFADAVAMRIYRSCSSAAPVVVDPNLDAALLSHFYEACPYLKFAHFTANQAILEAFEGKNRVHVIDFSMNDGLQWPALMQALAVRPGGPPSFRLTGIGPPSPDNSDHLQEVGWKLAQLAEAVHVEFEYRGYVTNSLADLSADILDLRSDESVAVNSIFDLHKLLACPGSLEKVLNLVKSVSPVIFTIVEQEANHNGPDFQTRFTEALHYYSTLFDSINGSDSANSEEDRIMSELYLGRQILDVVGFEGTERVERHERLEDWKNRICSAGFDPVCLGSNAFKQASMLLALFGGGEGYGVEESDGCLFLGWHTRPLIATSAWRVSAG